jgi:hypothetical protein
MKKRTLMGWGAMALAVTLLILAAPKAAHAIVATLVQVANTSANPAITQDVSKLASQSVELVCLPNVICGQVLPNGSIVSNYSVPAGSSLIVTTIQMNTILTGINTVQLAQLVAGSSAPVRGTWVLNGPGTFEFQYPSGIAIASGQEFFFVGGQNDNDHSYLIGYLVSN